MKACTYEQTRKRNGFNFVEGHCYDLLGGNMIFVLSLTIPSITWKTITLFLQSRNQPLCINIILIGLGFQLNLNSVSCLYLFHQVQLPVHKALHNQTSKASLNQATHSHISALSNHTPVNHPNDLICSLESLCTGCKCHSLNLHFKKHILQQFNENIFKISGQFQVFTHLFPQL